MQTPAPSRVTAVPLILTKVDEHIATARDGRAPAGFMTTCLGSASRTRREEDSPTDFVEMRFAGFVTASAPSDEKLERASGEVEHAGQLARLEFQRMHGRPRRSRTHCHSAGVMVTFPT